MGHSEYYIGAEGGTRTHTLLRAPDFESGASTNSTTPATDSSGQLITCLRVNPSVGAAQYSEVFKEVYRAPELFPAIEYTIPI
jgi:hypothetical protein